jgi:hypothetical protein
MGKRRIDQIAGHDPWEIEALHWWREGIGPQPLDPDTADALTIICYMNGGDLRPLAAAIRSHVLSRLRKGPEVHKLHPGVLLMLARMIDDGRLSVKRSGRGNRQQGIFARDVLMLHLREHAKKSEKEIADELGENLEVVHQTLIKARKMRRKGFNRW